MEEHFIRVQRTARFHSLGTIDGAPELWIALHGYGQLARFFLNAFDGNEEGRCIIAPEGLSRYYLDAEHARVGATWMTREDRLHEIDDQIAYLDAITTELKRRIMPGAPINVLGFSQGVATAARWSLRSSTPINRLVFWAGAIPPELDRDAMTAWRNTPVDLVLGDRDEYATPADLHASVRRLEAAGVNGREHLFAGTHRLEPVLLRRLLGG